MGERICIDMSTIKELLNATSNNLEGPKSFAQVKSFEDENSFNVRIDLPNSPHCYRIAVTQKTVSFSVESLVDERDSSFFNYSGTVTVYCDCCDITGVETTVKDGVLTMILPKDQKNKCLLTPFTGYEGESSGEGGLMVNLMEVEPMTVEDFDAKLDASLMSWKHQGKKRISIKLPSELSSLVDSATKRGFTIDRAENDYVMLTSSISETPTTTRICAFVPNKNKEVLVVQETGSSSLNGPGVWNLPTGVMKEGESISAAAVREVEEETGVETKFVKAMACWGSHQSILEKTDVLVLCQLEPTTTNYEIKKQDYDIFEAKWMPIEEYVNQPFIDEDELFMVKSCCLKKTSQQQKKEHADQSQCDQAL